jgi:hypothetical protein
MGGGGDGSFYSDLVTLGLTSNLQLVLDAGARASYPSAGKWLDLAGSGYDFFRGADGDTDGDEPTHNGTPGGLSSSEYFSFDGGDFFTYDSANETWMNNMSKDSGQFSIIIWVYHNAFSGNESYVNTLGSGSPGVNFGKDASSGIQCQLQGSSQQLDDLPKTSAWNMIGWTARDGETDGTFGWLGNADQSGYNQQSASDTFTLNWTGSSDANETLRIGASNGSAVNPLAASARVAGVMIWAGGFITKANMDSIWARQKTRFGL